MPLLVSRKVPKDLQEGQSMVMQRGTTSSAVRKANVKDDHLLHWMGKRPTQTRKVLTVIVL